MALKPKKRQGLTTGEVSEVLDGTISQTTVQRYLDNGILTGWKNPITGKRLIDLESVKALAKKFKIELASERQVEKNLKAIRRKRSRKKEG